MDICGRQVLNTTQNLTIAECVSLKELPSEFGQLTQLTSLGLNSNYLDSLPTELGQLTRLKWLDLGWNILKELPTEFGQLTQLTSLDLATDWELEATLMLPTEFGQLTRLKWLDLNSNNLEVLPTEFGQLTQLKWLDLEWNSLKELPTEFWQLLQLTSLDLGWNSLKELPTEFGLLTQLTSLDLETDGDLETTHVLPTEFGQLTELNSLDLNSNNLEVLPNEFGQLTQLTWLDLARNSLKELPSEFGKLTQITSLDLATDGSVDATHLEVLPTEFGQLTRLILLDLASNLLTELPTEFGRMTQLETLNLQSNHLNSLPTEFGQMTRLTTLKLDTNRLEKLPTEFGQLTQLTSLDLVWNRLEQLPTEFGQLTQLTSLLPHKNFLVALPTEFGQLTQLTSLDFNENMIKVLPTEFGQLTRLTSLVFEQNGLELLPTEFGQLTQLTSLVLGSNNLKQLPTEFGKLAQLNWLDLLSKEAFTFGNVIGNSLKELPTEFGQLTHLHGLVLDGNGLELLPTEFGQLTELALLTLSLNNLNALPTEFGQLTQLSTLDLAKNSFEVLPTEFGQLTQLTSLQLKQNNLTELPTEFGRLTQLSLLLLKDNSLKELPFPPQNLAVTVVRSASMDLEWSAPAVQWTTIVGYEARVTSGGLTVPFLPANNQLGVNFIKVFGGFGASHRSSVQVMAKFVGGYHSSYSKPLNVTTCPASMERENTIDVDACYALAGFYRNSFGFARSCTDLENELPPGAIGQCLKARLGVKGLPIQEKFWRASLSSEDIRLCPAVQFCIPQSSGRSFASPDGYCTPYHAGTYCSDCVEDYVIGEDGCTFCTKEAKESTGQLILLVCTLLFVFCLLYVYVLSSAGCFSKKILCCRRSSRRQNSPPSSRYNRCKLLGGRIVIFTKLRILFGYFQVLSSYRRTFLKQSLADSGDLLGVMALLSNVDLTWLVGNAAFRCVYDYSHYDLLLVATLGPIGLAFLLFVCTTTTTYCIVPKLMTSVMHHTVSALLLMLFLIYPYVSQTVLGTFWCESFPDADRRFNLTTSALRADYRLSCEHNVDSKRLDFEIYAGVMVLVYPVGVVALYSWVLYVHKDRVMALGNTVTAKENEEKLTKVSFLIKPYKVKRFWFEAYELVRKLMQTSLVGFLVGLPVEPELPAFLASISLCLTVVFVVFLLLFQPYKHPSDFAFAVMSLLLLLPASLYSLLDPYARHEGISEYGLEALVITELCVFALFVVFEVGRVMSVGRVKEGSCSCANRCLERGGGSVSKQVGDDGVGDAEEMQVDWRLVTALKKKIVELEASRESLKAENQQLRQRTWFADRTVEPLNTSIQPL